MGSLETYLKSINSKNPEKLLVDQGTGSTLNTKPSIEFDENNLIVIKREKGSTYSNTAELAVISGNNTGIRSGDGGGIEGWGMGRDNIIDHNIIYNAYRGIATNGWRGHSIFLDDAAHHVTVTNNIIYDENAVAVNAGVFIKSINNVVVNNVFDVGYAKNGAADIAPYICPAGGSVFRHNIVYSRSEGMLNSDGTLTESENSDRIMLFFDDGANSSGTPVLESLREMNRNLYWNAAGEAQIRVNSSLLSLEEWKTDDRNVNRYDADSLCEDPLFADAEHHDYRLRENSPANKLGIRSIDASEIGLLPEFRF